MRAVTVGIRNGGAEPAFGGPGEVAWWVFERGWLAAREHPVFRLMAGGVFLWEGVLKFVYANQGVGRFTKLGFPLPELTAGLLRALAAPSERAAA